MRVYKLDADVNHYRGIYYTDDDDIVEFNRRFNGTSVKNAPCVEGKFAFVPRRLRKGDTPGLSSHIPVFSLKAAKALVELLEGHGELIPINCNGEDYFLFNVTKVIDALDKDNCELELFDDGTIMDVVRYSFFPKRLEGVTVFKIPQARLMDVFVTAPFVDRVKAAKLKGFKLPHIWSSDDEPDRTPITWRPFFS